mmetsp:Transcript_9367/g.16987  ORF Transcript_9367/g.16987 Transcript_9367/m.16987 type:complete len:216 (-) Transcript_9367:47-694(-)
MLGWDDFWKPMPRVSRSTQPGTLERARLKPGEDISMRRYFWEVGLARMVVRVFRSVSTAREEGERRLQERVICSRKGLEERAEGTFTEGWDATGADLVLLLFVVVAWPLKRWRAAVPDFLTAADLTDVGLEDDASCLLRAIASFKSSSSEFDEGACEEVAEGDGRVMSTTVGVAAGGGFRSRATARSRLLSVRERASRHEVSGKPIAIKSCNPGG